MNAAGSPTEGGPGNGLPPRLNPVARSPLWRECRQQIEEDYPFVAKYNVLGNVEVLMTVLDVEEDARLLSGDTWFVETPEDYFPRLSIYFTYVDGAITLQAVHASDW